MSSTTPITTYHDVELSSGVTIHYAEAGENSQPNVLLLHGFPTSSFQFRNLIPKLSSKYHVIAPDLPGFGFTKSPTDYQHSFTNLAKTLSDFIDIVHLDKKGFAVYIFDYGAPTLFRLALTRPKLIRGIISQNGNAYTEGLDMPFWNPLKQWWNTQDRNDENFVKAFKNFLGSCDNFHSQYYGGVPTYRIDRIDPHFQCLDYLLNVKEKIEVQLDLFFDYGSNAGLYPDFQRYLRESQVPVLAVWGENDVCFNKEGAEAYRRDVKEAKVVLLDGGHFLLETHLEEVAELVLEFLGTVKF